MKFKHERSKTCFERLKIKWKNGQKQSLTQMFNKFKSQKGKQTQFQKNVLAYRTSLKKKCCCHRSEKSHKLHNFDEQRNFIFSIFFPFAWFINASLALPKIRFVFGFFCHRQLWLLFWLSTETYKSSITKPLSISMFFWWAKKIKTMCKILILNKFKE